MEDARGVFERREREALGPLKELEDTNSPEGSGLRYLAAENLADLAASDALRELTEKGLLQQKVADRAKSTLSVEIKGNNRL